MPSVVDQSQDAAEAVLKDRGNFNVTVKKVPGDGTKDPGTVVDQQPNAGAKVEKGDDVTITIVDDDAGDPSDPPSSPNDPNGPGGNGGGGNGGGQFNNGVIPDAIGRRN
jgi:serine/threonine-protein kinase